MKAEQYKLRRACGEPQHVAACLVSMQKFVLDESFVFVRASVSCPLASTSTRSVLPLRSHEGT